MKQITRRQFMSKSGRRVASVALAGTALSAASATRVLGANERVRVALIGCGGRGSFLARGMIEQGAELAYLCDLHDGRLEKTADFVSDVQRQKPTFSKDMREVFDDKNVDAVMIGMPDHWHAPASIMACQSGKDVYVEKPHAHSIWESRKMIEAARKYDRVMQVGTQNRSAPYDFAARDYIKSGKLGDIHLVKVYNLKSARASQGPFYLGDPGEKPAGFDWDAWLGAAPERPYHQDIFASSGWHHYWDFSGGDFLNDASHQADLAMMVLGEPGLPKAVSCSGGRMHHKDDSEVPDLQIITYDFDEFVMTLEHSAYLPYMRKTTGTIRRNDELPYWTQNSTRIELYGSELMMILGRHGGGWIVMTSGGKIVDQMYGRYPDEYHWRNFLAAVKRDEKPTADVEILHPSCCMLHMANISYRVGNQKLWFDTKKERFIDNAAANKFLKRDYRKGYEVPEKV